MEDLTAWQQIIEALVYFFKYGNPGIKFLMVMFSFLLIGGTGTGITQIILTALGQRHQRLLATQETAKIEAIAKLSEAGQLRLLETFPGIDPNNPKDMEAAQKAQAELKLLTTKDEEAS
jgi:hypothetical protein